MEDVDVAFLTDMSIQINTLIEAWKAVDQAKVSQTDAQVKAAAAPKIDQAKIDDMNLAIKALTAKVDAAATATIDITPVTPLVP